MLERGGGVCVDARRALPTSKTTEMAATNGRQLRGDSTSFGDGWSGLRFRDVNERKSDTIIRTNAE